MSEDRGQRCYTYDGAGRLTATVEGGTTRSYFYDDDTNRCLTSSCTGNTAWTYDFADRITKSPYASAYVYDSHGNTTATTGTSGNPSASIGYDANDHATVVNDGTTTVSETLAPSGRVLRRVVTTNATSAVVEDVSYGYSSGGDSPAYSRPTAGGIITTYLMGLSGLTDVGGTGTWSIYDAHGDVQGTTNAAGTFTATPTADEFGVGATPASRLGWLGKQQRPSVGGTLGLVRMGVRLYDPKLGRFLEVDPVEMGNANDYVYPADPINQYDLTGEMNELGAGGGRWLEESVPRWVGNMWDSLANFRPNNFVFRDGKPAFHWQNHDYRIEWDKGNKHEWHIDTPDGKLVNEQKSIYQAAGAALKTLLDRSLTSGSSPWLYMMPVDLCGFSAIAEYTNICGGGGEVPMA